MPSYAGPYANAVGALKAEADEIVAELERIHARAAGENRDLRASEQRKWDELTARLTQVNAKLAEEVEVRRRAQAALGSAALIHDGSTGRSYDGPAEPTVLNPSESLRSYVERRGRVRGDEPTLGEVVQGLAGLRPLPEAARALGEQVGPSGGFLISEAVSSEILDMARARSVLVQAGARIRPVESPEVRYPRLDSDFSASWVAENAAIPETGGTFGAISHRARKLATLLRVSRELLDDAPELDAFLRSALAEVFALELDRAGLYGNQLTEPAGISGWSGISTVDMGANGATPTSYDQVMDAIAAVRAGNYEPSAWIANPRDFKTYGKLKATDNQPLVPPADVAALRKLATTKVPTNLTKGTSSDTSELFIADFREYSYSLRTAFSVQVLQERYADQGQVGLVATLRADGSPLREAAFCKVVGVRP